MEKKAIVLAGAGEPEEAVRSALDRNGHALAAVRFGAELPPGRLAIVDGERDAASATAFCRKWRADAGPDAPIVWIAGAIDPFSRTAGWEAGADAVLVRPLCPGEVAAQVERLLRYSEERERLAVGAAQATRINDILINMYREADADIRVARRVQRALRPVKLPKVGRAHLAVSQRLRNDSAADFYFAQRVDEEHVAFLLGDAMGHNISSCLLGVHVRLALTTKEIDAEGYRLLSPDVVLQRLNRAVAGIGLPEPPMIRLTYGLVNAVTGELSCASAGQTPPLYLPKDGDPELWRNVGPLLGPLDAVYPVQRVRLGWGDRVLFYTDGLHGTEPEQAEALLQWAQQRSEQYLPAYVETLTQVLLSETPEPDDFTLLGLEFAGPMAA